MIETAWVVPYAAVWLWLPATYVLLHCRAGQYVTSPA
jgi:hypothetical protein